MSIANLSSAAAEAAKTGMFSALHQGVASMDEMVYLVSQDNKKFAIHEEVLKCSSDFFRAALETRMREAGKYLADSLSIARSRRCEKCIFHGWSRLILTRTFFFAGTREIMCKEPSEVLRAVITAMLYTKKHFLSAEDDSTVKAEQTIDILRFSKRCLMPWIGIGYALRAVKSTTDLRLLLELLKMEDFVLDMDLKDDEEA